MVKRVSDHNIDEMLMSLRLPGMREIWKDTASRAAKEGLGHLEMLRILLDHEQNTRRQRRIERLMRNSRLPMEKTLESYNMSRFPMQVSGQLALLKEGSFVNSKENVLCFGNPGSGKTHLMCGLGLHLASQGFKVSFHNCPLLVQELLSAKREHKLHKSIASLVRNDVLVLDEIGYVEQDRNEMETLFTLLAECYERTSILLTSNLPFSKWDRIFKDPMTTAAAIDRLVHHSIILELNVPSYRMEMARAKKEVSAKNSRN